MQGLDHATPGTLLLLFFLLIPAVYAYINRFQIGKNTHIRRLGGIDAIEEAVGASTEMGRPIAFTVGLTGLGPVLIACLGVLKNIATKAAVLRTKLIVPQRTPEVMALVESTLRSAYRSVRKEHEYSDESTPYLSDEQFAFASGYMGLVQREKVGAAFLFGNFAAESLLLAEAGQQIGAYQIGASVSPEQVPFFVATCDYNLIGEELFAASAYLTREPIQVATLRAQDLGKIILVLVITYGIFIETVRQLVPGLKLSGIADFFTRGW